MSPRLSDEQLDTRFDELVAFRGRCRSLSIGHLDALDSFRTTEAVGRRLAQLDRKAVSIPSFRRDKSPLVDPAGRSASELRVSSTCAAIRSLLRNPSARYEELRPLAIVVELWWFLERDRSTNVLAWGQVSNLMTALVEALKAVKGPGLPKDRVEEQGDVEYFLRLAKCQAISQVFVELAKLGPTAQALVAEDQQGALNYSLARMDRFTFLAANHELGVSNPTPDDYELNELFQLPINADRRQMLATTAGEALLGSANGIGAVDDPILDQVKHAMEASDLELGDIRDIPTERVLSLQIASSLGRVCRQRIRGFLEAKSEYSQVTLDRFTPAHPYVLYWILSGLTKSDIQSNGIQAILREQRDQYHRILALSASGSRGTDAIRLGYHLAVEVEFNPAWDRDLATAAVRLIVASQTSDGGFEKRDRIWLTERGDAYGLGVELLNSLLVAFRRSPEYQEQLEGCLLGSIEWLERTLQTFNAESGLTQYATWGEHAGTELSQPQAWVTGEAYSFLFMTEGYASDRIADLAIQKFGGMRSTSPVPLKIFETSELAKLSADFWGTKGSPRIVDVLRYSVIAPLEAHHRYFGHYVLSSSTQRHMLQRSGIIYGPPGTGKTTLVEGLAGLLGWPLISLSPSNFLRLGTERVAEAAGEVFRWLIQLRDCVVLLDEMEEFVRSRDATVANEPLEKVRMLDASEVIKKITGGQPAGSQEAGVAIQRLWTTLFLPHLQQLHDEAAVIFLVATNHFDQIDAAIARPGRFDFIIHMLPPSPVKKIQDVLSHQMRHLNGISLDDSLVWDSVFLKLLSTKSWIVVGRNPMLWTVTESNNLGARADYVKTTVANAAGRKEAVDIQTDLRFGLFTRADTYQLAERLTQRLREGYKDIRVTDLSADIRDDLVLRAFADVVPTAFSYDVEADYLQESRLRPPWAAPQEGGT